MSCSLVFHSFPTILRLFLFRTDFLKQKYWTDLFWPPLFGLNCILYFFICGFSAPQTDMEWMFLAPQSNTQWMFLPLERNIEWMFLSHRQTLNGFFVLHCLISFYKNLLVQNFDPFPAYKKCAVSCNSCFQLKAHWFWIVGTEIESESQNRFSRPRKFGPPKI